MVGCGNMGGALLRRWLDQPGYRFTVVSPSGRTMPSGVTSVRSADALAAAKFDVIVLAVKPQMIPAVLPAYPRLVSETGCFVSIAAGYSIDSLEGLVGNRPMVRIMPNMPVQVGKGVSAVFANPQTSPEHRRTVETLMKTTGKLIWVETEDQIDRLTAIVGSGPGYVYEIARCWTKAAHGLGFPEDEARAMVLQTLAGAIELAVGSEVSLDELRNGVTSKNGTTAAGLSALNRDASLDNLLQQTVEAAYARAIELR